jgi:hypothetical protein
MHRKDSGSALDSYSFTSTHTSFFPALLFFRHCLGLVSPPSAAKSFDNEDRGPPNEFHFRLNLHPPRGGKQRPWLASTGVGEPGQSEHLPL